MNILMLAASAHGRKAWFGEWLNLNRINVAKHSDVHMLTTMKNGDTILWATAECPDKMRGYEFGMVFIDERCSTIEGMRKVQQLLPLVMSRVR